VCRGPHQTRQVDHFLDKVLDDLYLATHCRSYLWIYDGQHTLLERMRGRQGQPTVVNVGHEMHNEAHATAAGKAVFAYAPPGVVANYIHSVGLQPFTPNTITDPVCLGNELEKVRCEGLAFSRGEYVESVFGIAFALKFCREGHAVIAALAATVPRQRFVEQEGELVRLVRGVAMRASRALSC
jgi:DNA-binding IclR family transcriptional regulator